MHSVKRILGYDWTFTRIGGGQETEGGEWLETSAFPTSVHVELLHLRRIPDPVSWRRYMSTWWNVLISNSTLGSMSGMYNVRATDCLLR
jgi:hypothetical protein